MKTTRLKFTAKKAKSKKERKIDAFTRAIDAVDEALTTLSSSLAASYAAYRVAIIESHSEVSTDAYRAATLTAYRAAAYTTAANYDSYANARTAFRNLVYKETK